VIALRARNDSLIPARAPSEEVLTSQREAELCGAEANRADAVRAVFDAWTANAPPGLHVAWIDTDGIVELVVE